MTWERILKVVKTYILKGQVIQNPNPYLNLGAIPVRKWNFWGNLHFRFCKNGPAKRAALPWLSWKVLFLFGNLNSVLPQETFIIYLEKATFSTMRALSKADLKPSRANMHGAASLWKEKQTLSLPPTCTQLVLCEKGKFALDGEFSKNAPYKQKIIFHLTSIGKMSRKFFFCLGR